jgi:hypothetical protein
LSELYLLSATKSTSGAITHSYSPVAGLPTRLLSNFRCDFWQLLSLIRQDFNKARGVFSILSAFYSGGMLSSQSFRNPTLHTILLDSSKRDEQ